MASRVRTNPTAIWFRRSSMLAKAMMAAMTIPTAMAATNPNSTLPATKAVANPVSAESMMVPSSERLMTPDFSAMFSPMAA